MSPPPSYDTSQSIISTSNTTIANTNTNLSDGNQTSTSIPITTIASGEEDDDIPPPAYHRSETNQTIDEPLPAYHASAQNSNQPQPLIELTMDDLEQQTAPVTPTRTNWSWGRWILFVAVIIIILLLTFLKSR
ncbi:3638_t:CDS:1 [Ambispora gerdemannii]|uniref:3638_t:CDS:1 n=1 Tax=Ambispora gerdemannii TaxID=144530 RepID=A0A9N9B071_9GLOM|nr:3638_t:CDS:1 [Ambispora gerdemannii]